RGSVGPRKALCGTIIGDAPGGGMSRARAGLPLIPNRRKEPGLADTSARRQDANGFRRGEGLQAQMLGSGGAEAEAVPVGRDEIHWLSFSDYERAARTACWQSVMWWRGKSDVSPAACAISNRRAGRTGHHGRKGQIGKGASGTGSPSFHHG